MNAITFYNKEIVKLSGKEKPDNVAAETCINNKIKKRA